MLKLTKLGSKAGFVLNAKVSGKKDKGTKRTGWLTPSKTAAKSGTVNSIRRLSTKKHASKKTLVEQWELVPLRYF
jgi:hypothetical protein